MRRFGLTCAVLAFVTLSASACGGGDGDGPITFTTLTGNLSGTQEVPAVVTAATGTATLVYDSITSTFSLNISVTGLTVGDITAFHLHLAPIGQNGAIVVDLSGGGMFFADVGGGTITSQGAGIPYPANQAVALLNGGAYLNIHTTAYPTGEIRAQMVP